VYRLRRLWLREFRNYERAELSVEPGVTALVGPNGSGKSNLLEAVYLVATGRSHRIAYEGEAIRHGQPAARVRAHILRRGAGEDLEATIVRQDARTAIQLKVNGAPTTRGSLLGRLPVVMAAPWDIDAIRGSSAMRRRTIDAAVAQLSPAYYFALHRYHRVILQRNVALRRGRAGATDAWDAQMVALGVRLTLYRRGYVDRLGPRAGAWYERLDGGGRLTVAYRPSWAGDDHEDISSAAGVQIAQRRAEEIKRGVSLCGPHRDELDLTLDGRPLRAIGSQGQWRAAMLAVRFAERDVMAEELESEPLLLLDDVLAELDQARQRRLLDICATGQVLLTATELPPVASHVRTVTVSSGMLEGAVWSPRFVKS
jgi:DNA replication and repair protein RecF